MLVSINRLIVLGVPDRNPTQNGYRSIWALQRRWAIQSWFYPQLKQKNFVWIDIRCFNSRSNESRWICSLLYDILQHRCLPMAVSSGFIRQPEGTDGTWTVKLTSMHDFSPSRYSLVIKIPIRFIITISIKPFLHASLNFILPNGIHIHRYG